MQNSRRAEKRKQRQLKWRNGKKKAICTICLLLRRTEGLCYMQHLNLNKKICIHFVCGSIHISFLLVGIFMQHLHWLDFCCFVCCLHWLTIIFGYWWSQQKGSTSSLRSIMYYGLTSLSDWLTEWLLYTTHRDRHACLQYDRCWLVISISF